MTGWKEHYWNDVPFCEYVNNRERIGDFEGVLSEIDAYNRVQSNTANYFQYNDDAILKVTRLGGCGFQGHRADEAGTCRYSGGWRGCGLDFKDSG